MTETKYAKDDSGKFLQQVGTDGRRWAEAFMEMWGHRLAQVDESLMQGWFCNALMAMYDERNKVIVRDLTQVHAFGLSDKKRQWIYDFVKATLARESAKSNGVSVSLEKCAKAACKASDDAQVDGYSCGFDVLWAASYRDFLLEAKAVLDAIKRILTEDSYAK